ncbi:MAG: hypothetical protein EAZ92_03090 [Candidatus Kapaibacterium sp.]|nr:MAG: hypothetical protein EAZ92_03090 [Candidatus Kapabacteria bacterium]
MDDGAAPNPYWGICTLAICKPVIRRVAEVGDWIVGTGSKQFGFENKVVYAMKITQKLTLKEYDDYCRKELVKKIPLYKDADITKRVGDCIYDFTLSPPKLRDSVHDEGNIKTDLGGKCALLSTHFYYFGKEPKALPLELYGIVQQGQGHRSSSNEPFVELFVSWITTEFSNLKNQVTAQPHYIDRLFKDDANTCARRHEQEDKEDEDLVPHC